MHRSQPRVILALLLVSLLGLPSCCTLFPSACLPNDEQGIAEISLVLDVHPDWLARFHGMTEAQQNLSVENAWATARGLLPAAAYTGLRTYAVPLGTDGYPTRIGLRELAETYYRSAGFVDDLDDPPTGCQFDHEHEPPKSIKCQYDLREVLVPASVMLQEIRYKLAFVVHARFLEPGLVAGA